MRLNSLAENAQENTTVKHQNQQSSGERNAASIRNEDLKVYMCIPVYSLRHVVAPIFMYTNMRHKSELSVSFHHGIVSVSTSSHAFMLFFLQRAEIDSA